MTAWSHDPAAAVVRYGGRRFHLPPLGNRIVGTLNAIHPHSMPWPRLYRAAWGCEPYDEARLRGNLRDTVNRTNRMLRGAGAEIVGERGFYRLIFADDIGKPDAGCPGSLIGLAAHDPRRKPGDRPEDHPRLTERA